MGFRSPELAVVEDHLDGIPYRKLQRKYAGTKDTLNRLTNRILDELMSSTEVTRQLKPVYGDGIFLADGKFFRCKRIITDECGEEQKRKYPRGRCQLSIMHWASHDIAVTVYGESESEELWREAWEKMRELHISVRYVVADEKTACAQALKRIFPEAILQLCHAHFVREIEKKLLFRHIERRLNKLGKEIDRVSVGLNRSGCIPWKKRAVMLTNDMADIEHRSYFLFEFVDLINELLASNSFEEKTQRMIYIQLEWFPLYAQLAPHDTSRKKIRTLWRKLCKKEHELFAYLSIDQSILPKTTNALEGWHNQIQLRLDSIRGFESPKTGDAYMNALTLWRRFRPYTDCKKHFKHLNGQSPLQAAGVNIKQPKKWILTVLKSDQT